MGLVHEQPGIEPRIPWIHDGPGTEAAADPSAIGDHTAGRLQGVDSQPVRPIRRLARSSEAALLPLESALVTVAVIGGVATAATVGGLAAAGSLPGQGEAEAAAAASR